MTWNNPPAQVKALSEMCQDGEATPREVMLLYKGFEDHGTLDVSPDRMYTALENRQREDLSVLVSMLVADDSYGSKWTAVCRYVGFQEFPWQQDRSYEDTSVDEVVDSNISDVDILEIAEELDGDGMSLMGELPDAVLNEHIPDDLPDEEVRSVVSSKCANALRKS